MKDRDDFSQETKDALAHRALEEAQTSESRLCHRRVVQNLKISPREKLGRGGIEDEKVKPSRPAQRTSHAIDRGHQSDKTGRSAQDVGA
jgi:hypothetical protein